MALLYLFLLIGAFSSVFCQHCNCKDLRSSGLVLEVYGAYLIGFTMLIMLLIIIGLSVALYMLKTNKSMFGISVGKNPAYVREISTQGVVGSNYTPNNTTNDSNKYNGSTLTVNSGIVELGGLGEPETPTPTLKEPRDENKLSVYIKPKGPKPVVQRREQMDILIQQVLERKRQKSESTMLNELDMIANANSDSNECLYANTSEIQPKRSPSSTIKKSPTLQSNRKDNSEIKLSVDDEHEVYDTLPSPVRYPGAKEDDTDIKDIPVYDLPPTRHRIMGESDNVVMDSDTDYMLLVSKNSQRDQDEACYINAKRHQ